jgi:hypothetical protein
MRIDIKFPMLFKARTGRHQSDKQFLVSHLQSVDVPEIGAGEAAVVFSCGIAPGHDLRVFPKGQERFEIVEWDGKIFRKAGAATSEHWRKFPNDVHGTSLSVSPVNAPLALHNKWVLYSAGAYHAEILDPLPATENRDLELFHVVNKKLVHIDTESLATAFTLIERRSEGLLVIDGDLWVETTPPGYLVSPTPKQKGVNTPSVVDSIGLSPCSFDFKLFDRWFPLSDKAAADEYHDEAVDALHRQPGVVGVGGVDKVIDYEVEGACSLLGLESTIDPAFRTAALLAVRCARGETRTSAANVGAEQKAALGRVMAGLGQLNHVLGVVPDITPDIAEIPRIWAKMYRPMSDELGAGHAGQFLIGHVERTIDGLQSRRPEIISLEF